MAQSRINTRPLKNLNDLRPIRDPHHWYNYIKGLPHKDLAYRVLNPGVSSFEILSCPPNKSETERLEWLALILHNLIDRISIFYDFVILTCNDGTRELNFTEPLFYGSEIVLESIGKEATQLIMSANSKCVGRVKIGSNECFPVRSSLYGAFPHTNFPEMCADIHETGLGASTYILMMIDQFKTIRDNPEIFPYKVDQDLSYEFLNVAKYLLFHMMTIMSHITECHFVELAEQQLNRHLFTLNLWIFMTGCQFDICPSASHVSTEFSLLCRHLIYNDFVIQRTRLPPTQPIPIEESVGAQPLLDEGPGPSGLQNASNSENNGNKVAKDLIVEQRRQSPTIQRANCCVDRPGRKRHRSSLRVHLLRSSRRSTESQ